MVYSNQQKSFLVESYFRNGTKVDGNWQYSLDLALAEFREEFPDVPIIYDEFKNTLSRSVGAFRETGSILRKPGSGRPVKRTEDVVNTAQQILDEEPTTSLRHLSQQINLSVGTCHTLLRQDLHVYPYRITSVQELLPIDYPRRLEFCQWFLQNLNEDVLQISFFTDEAWFYKDGYINSQTMRIWSDANPHSYREKPLHPEKVGVWAAISGRRLVGPIFFDGTLNGDRYHTEILLPFINELHDDELQNGYFQQDGATPHCTINNLATLEEFFDDRIISRNTAIPWPSRSCDLAPCDFFLWPYLKNCIYAQPVQHLRDLRQRILEKFEEINNNPRLLRNVMEGLRRRVQGCAREEGRHMQHLL